MPEASFFLPNQTHCLLLLLPIYTFYRSVVLAYMKNILENNKQKKIKPRE